MACNVNLQNTLTKFYNDAAYFSVAPSHDYTGEALNGFQQAAAALGEIWKNTQDPLLEPLANVLKGLTPGEFQSPLTIAKAVSKLAAENSRPPTNPFA